jgi:3-phosphoshikimate 1-carboxyvinyltransferase
MRGGAASVEAVTSQYLTSLLIASPFAPGNTGIVVPLLNERPYVEMTLAWIERLGVRVEHDGFRRFRIQGGQRCRAFDAAVPADFSSATFFMVAAAILGAEVTLRGLDPSDTQGDREVASILAKMGARVDASPGAVTVRGGSLTGGVFDLNAMPDALPALAVAGCFAAGETRLVNVAQARVKETDRIAVMCAELRKMGADIEELADGILVRGRTLRGASVRGHGDHRVVMSLAVAGLAASGKTTIDTAECVSVTFPGFMELVKSLGGNISIAEE